MTDIVERLRGLDRDAYDWFAVVDRAAAEIERLTGLLAEWENHAGPYKDAEIEHLRTTLGYLADNIDNPALVAVAEAALVRKT